MSTSELLRSIAPCMNVAVRAVALCACAYIKFKSSGTEYTYFKCNRRQ